MQGRQAWLAAWHFVGQFWGGQPFWDPFESEGVSWCLGCPTTARSSLPIHYRMSGKSREYSVKRL